MFHDDEKDGKIKIHMPCYLPMVPTDSFQRRHIRTLVTLFPAISTILSSALVVIIMAVVTTYHTKNDFIIEMPWTCEKTYTRK